MSASAGDGAGPVLPSVAASEGLGQLYTALSSWPLVITGAVDINTDCGRIRAMNPDMVPCSSPGPDITKAPGGNQATTLACSSLLSPLQTCHLPQEMKQHSVILSVSVCLSARVSLSLPSYTMHLLTTIVTMPFWLSQGGPCFLL